MKYSVAVILGLGSLLVGSAHAGLYSLSSSPSLAETAVSPFVTSDTLADFYDFRQWEYHGDVFVQANTANMFLVDASDGLGLVMVFDNGKDGSGGKADVKIDVGGDLLPLDFEVMDDLGGNDTFDDGDTLLTADLQWSSGKTDGYILIPLKNSDPQGLGYVDTTLSGLVGIDSWNFYSFPGASKETYDLVLTETARLSVQPVPEPSVLLGFLTAGSIGLLFIRRRRR